MDLTTGIQAFADVRNETWPWSMLALKADTDSTAVLSIFSSVEKCFITAHVLIFVGYEFDRFDGIVARWRNECSDWGKELDSFCDLVRTLSFHSHSLPRLTSF